MRDVKGRDVGFASREMEQDYLAAEEELRSLNYNIYINQGQRTLQEDIEAKERSGFSQNGSREHVKGIALDIGINDITAFSSGHIPTENGLKAAEAIAPIMAKHGFKWMGKSDIVHFSYTKDIGQVNGVAKLPSKKNDEEEKTPSESFFEQTGVLNPILTKFNSLPDKKIKKISNFLLLAGKRKV